MNIKTFQKVRTAFLTLSIILFPASFYYLSPVIPLRGGAVGLITGSLIIFCILLIAATVFGRSFCSWLCPAGGIQDWVAVSRTRPVRPRKVGWIKYIVWGSWLAILLFFFFRAGGVQGIRFAFATEMGMSTTDLGALIVYTMVIMVFFILSLVFGKRTGCHTICWIAPFMVIGRKIGLALRLPSLKLKADPGECVSCGRCTTACPMSLDVRELLKTGNIIDNNCILCGRCIDTCKRNVISFSWRRSV